MLKDPLKKEEAFKELNDKRELIPNLAPVLWHSIGTVAILLQEIISIYCYLTPPTLS
jgi:CCR4-NOT transcription complex subunit 9